MTDLDPQVSFRLELPRWDLNDFRGRREVWEVLHANQRGGRQYGRRQRVTNQVIHTVATLARAAHVPPSAHVTVELVWAPERANRNRDADNLWPLLKVACDALARGPIKRGRGRPGLDLVPDDTSTYMTKLCPRIATTDEHDPGLWLHITVTGPRPARTAPMTTETDSPIPDEDDPDTVWVRSDVLPDGTYAIGFNIGPDLSWTLPERGAINYALACFDIATEVEHDAAVLALLTGIGVPLVDAAKVIAIDLRGRRRLRTGFHGPLRYEPGLTMGGKPFLSTVVNGTRTGQLSPAELRDHATGVLTTVAAVRLDQDLQGALTDHFNLDDARARAMVANLNQHWPPVIWPASVPQPDPKTRR